MTALPRLRLFVFGLALLALALACDTSAAPTVSPATALADAAAGTATALAQAGTTNTPLPTAPPAASATVAASATSEPSVTPSPIGVEASVTPTTGTPVAATPDPNEVVGDIVYQDPLDGTGTWFWTFADDTAVFGIDAQTQQLKGTMLKAGNGWRFTVSPDTLRVGDQQVRVTMHTGACAENDEYGLMFRGSVDAEFNYSLYLFTVRCGGQARFLLIRGAETTVLADWTAAPALHPGAPADNTLLVWMAGDEFRFYANDQYLFTARDSALTEGFYGLYLYDRTAGGETIYYEDLIARAVNR
ncbi:MAG: hypothetical protein IT317_03485 [Anaerolineales bacterium]|nr:hypothetical protein [Anaerolineales bacterium]